MIKITPKFTDAKKSNNTQVPTGEKSYLTDKPAQDGVSFTNAQNPPQPQRSDDNLLGWALVGAGLVVAGLIVSRTITKIAKTTKSLSRSAPTEASLEKKQLREDRAIYIRNLKSKIATGMGNSKLKSKSASSMLKDKQFEKIDNAEVLKDLYSLLKMQSGKNRTIDQQKDIVKVLGKLHDVCSKRGNKADTDWAKNKLSQETDVLLDLLA